MVYGRLFILIVTAGICLLANESFGNVLNVKFSKLIFQVDTPDTDLPFPIKDTKDPLIDGGGSNIKLNDPSNINTEIEYDSKTKSYQVKRNIGNNIRYQNPSYMTLDEYRKYDMKKAMDEYWRSKSSSETVNNSKAFAPKINVKGKGFDRLFGGNTVDIRPQGSAEISMGVNVAKTENPQIPENQRTLPTFDFKQKIQLNVVGNIGEKLKLTTNFNTEATFDFENQIKLEYTGYEDEIIKKIEAGNVSLPLSGSLITGSQSLFGLKTELQFGRLTATTVFSQQKGQRSEINVSGGVQTNEYELKADNYEANKHFFLAHFFRDTYDKSMESLPLISSEINITRIQVWITNTNNSTQDTRNMLAFMDLAEARIYDKDIGIRVDSSLNQGGILPDNKRNNVYRKIASNKDVRGFSNATGALGAMSNPGGFRQSKHYEKIENARMLSESEYSLNAQLGFISLNQALDNDEVLGVAYEYTYQGKVFKVGELATDGITGKDALYLKLLKGTSPNPKLTNWDLMMKNVYSIGAYQVDRENFKLNIWYTNPTTNVDINYIPKEGVNKIPLIQLLGMDRIDQNGNAYPDGVFDYVDEASTKGGTINSRNGRVFFPVVEPFGSYLEKQLKEKNVDENDIKSIVFKELYDSTKIIAQQRPEFNRFLLKGTYQSAVGSEISLNAFNIPEGSVVVSAGGTPLQENVDYSVDYTLGKVRILNEGLLESQTPISVKLESNSLFSIQTKTFLGTHLNYRISEDFNIGSTLINLRERPLTQKVNFGDDPINNTMVGFDANYRKESKLLTTLVDKLPFLETKEKSEITFSGEYARLIPGHSKLVGKEGISYIDDFEGSQSAIDIRAFSTWQLASTPQGQPDLFPEAELNATSLSYGFNRSKISWYVIDQTFQINNALTPDHIRNDPMQQNHFMRIVSEQEVFQNKDLAGQQALSRIPTLDIAFYPEERGPYNYDKGPSSLSAGTNENGKLNDPSSRWGGLMRQLQTNNFEDANIEYIQFWVMDPFNQDYKEDRSNAGKLYFNLGNISEDILKDGIKTFENGLPNEEVPFGEFDGDSLSIWGRIPVDQIITPAFDPVGQDFQDVGLDGLSDNNEKVFFKGFVDSINNIISDPSAKKRITDDPSSDNYMYYQDPEHDQLKRDILERYKHYTGVDGNSPSTEKSKEITNGQFSNTAHGTRITLEDINIDNNLSTTESYFQYEVDISAQALNPENVGNNYITDVVRFPVPGETDREVYWYQFKIPVRSPNKIINGIQDFRSIRFIRMFLKGFHKPIYLRMARLELIRGEWRKYNFSLLTNGEGQQDDPNNTVFNVGAVNSDENSKRLPIRYVEPPGIQREQNLQSNVPAQLNEQSMVLQVCNLKDGDARGATRNLDLDMRFYKKLKMFVHAEASGDPDALKDNDLTLFVRLGTDFSRNYYEYELPLKTTAFGEDSPDRIWPEVNSIDLEFEKLKNVKKNMPPDQLAIEPYAETDGDRRITVMGNPNLSDVRSIMIGIRNPSKRDTFEVFSKNDDGEAKCAEVWVNELRLSDFVQTGGYAALARANAKLADLGNIAVAGNISTPGFGSIEKKVNERQRETIMQFDASSNIQLGKFLPEKTGIKIPMFLAYSEGIKNPQFDPLSPDIPFDEIPGNEEQVKDRKTQSQEYIKRRSINFTNVRKEKAPGSKSHFYDVENLSLTYSYNEIFKRDINTQYNTTKNYRGGMAYVFNANPKSVQPFSKVGFIRKSNYLKLIRDFNFYPGIKQLSLQTNVSRSYNESLIRNTTEGAIAFPQVTKNFNWLRNYNLKYDITKSLKFDFNARNNAVIQEPIGRVSKEDSTYNAFKDSVWNSIQNWGETTTYGHDFNITYDVPLNKLPLMDFISSSSIKYQGGYQWTRAPFSQDTMGHVIENSRTINLNTSLTMNTLYNKVGYLKKVNDKYRKGPKKKKKKKTSKKDKDKTKPSDKKGKDDKEDKKKEEKEDKDGPVVYVVDQITRLAMSLKNVSATYSHTDGTLLPGYNERTKFLGMNDGFVAPGFFFISGMQDYNLLGEQVRDFKSTSAENGWLIKQPYLTTQFANTVKDDISARASLEPIKYLRIDLNANRTTGQSLSGYYRWGADEFGDSTFVSQNLLTTGTFSTSIISVKTAFSSNKDLEASEAFNKFLQIRPQISSNLGEKNSNSKDKVNGYADGYGPLSQDVLIQAFYAAYTETSPTSTPTNILNIIPLPNWRISYNGLSRIELFKKFFQSVSISHAYRSSFSAGGYISNLQYLENNGDPFARDNANNFLPEYQFNGVTISEQFSPLFNVDFTLRNNLTGKLEVRRDRNLSLSLQNTQITETRGEEYIIGSGYRFGNVTLPFIKGGSIKSDLNVRADVSIRNNFTVTRRIEPLNTQVTAGQTIISIRTSADYAISQKLNLRLFFDRVINKPKIPTTFPTSNTNAGIALRFTITS